MFRATPFICLFVADPGKCSVNERKSLENKQFSLIVKSLNSYNIRTLELDSERANVAWLLFFRIPP